MSDNRRPLGHVLIEALIAYGAHEIFGIPGDFALPMFKSFEDCGRLPVYTMNHEPGVGFAADAAARWHGGLGVAAVTYGAGSLNIVNPVAGAFAERSPVVVISGAPSAGERQSGYFLHHQVAGLDTPLRVFREITCAQAVLDDPATAPGEIARVLREARDRSLPVYLELPRDMPNVACAPVPVLPPLPHDAAATDAAADEVLDMLRTARRAVIMVGVEVRRFGAEDAVADLARRLGLPVVTTFAGRGLLAGADDVLAGTYLGVAGDPAITASVESAEAILLLGGIVSDSNFGTATARIDRNRFIEVSGHQVTLRHHSYRAVAFKPFVDALCARAPAISGPVRPAPAPKPVLPAGLAADDGQVLPSDISRCVNDWVAAGQPLPIIVSDVGDCLFTAMEMTYASLCAPAYYAVMGFGVPGGLAIQAASGQRPLVLVGDGAFQMTGLELGLCARYGWDPVVIVYNNQGWEMLRAFEPEGRFNDLSEIDFAGLARAMGGEGRVVRTRADLAREFAAAMSTRGKFQLLDVRLPKATVSETLGRFVAALRARNAKPQP